MHNTKYNKSEKIPIKKFMIKKLKVNNRENLNQLSEEKPFKIIFDKYKVRIRR